MRHNVRLATRLSYHPIVLLLNIRQDSQFAQAIAYLVSHFCHRNISFTLIETPSWTLASDNIYHNVNRITKKATIAHLVAKDLSIPHLKPLQYNRCIMFTDGSGRVDIPSAALDIPSIL